MKRYKDTTVGSSELGRCLADGNDKEAKKVYEETTKRYEALYSEADRKWFRETQNRYNQIPVQAIWDSYARG